MASIAALVGFCVGLVQFIPPVLAQTSCASSVSPSYPSPNVADGYSARIVANGLSEPRSLMFDSNGNLLVVESGKGSITALKLKDDGGLCVSVENKQDVVSGRSLNHALEMSPDGKTLYSSDSDKLYSWSYDAGSMKTTSGPKTLIDGMDNRGHTTRTILLSKKQPDTILVSRGSNGNVDAEAEQVTTGHSQIRAFSINPAPSNPHTYSSGGKLIGWGLRNSVGVAEEPSTGGIFSVENSVDNVRRQGKDAHQNNPGEELNFHGYLNGTKTREEGGNFGYPKCYTTWNVDDLPDKGDLKVGTQFAIGELTDKNSDKTCADNYIAPRLAIAPHWAPLDIKFNNKGTVAWITAHGSWNRDTPDGYNLFAVKFANGQPVEPSTSMNAAIQIVSNPDLKQCPDRCFRPVGLAWDSKGRLFMTSDSTGEIYMIAKPDGSGIADADLDSKGAPSSGQGKSAALPRAVPGLGVWGAIMAVMMGAIVLSVIE